MLNRILFWRRPRVAVVELHGILSARENALNLKSAKPLIERAFGSIGKSGGHVILDIDSPGGSPVQSDLIGSLIRRLAEKKSATVHAVVQEVGASGGYWLACAADDIRANPMSIVGSIGVVGGWFGFHDFLSRHGVERRLHTAGENKARLDPFLPERPQDVAFIEKLMADIHARFIDWVRTRRAGKLKAEDSVIFDGSFFLAQQARDLGLVDGFADIESLVKEIAGPRARPRYFRPRRSRLLARLPRLMAQGAIEAALDAFEERQARIALRS